MLQLGILFLLLVPFYGYSQAKKVHFKKDDILIHARLWTKSEGVPHWYLSGAFQDSRGVLWANWKGTFCQFDGRRWSEITKEKENLHEFNTTYFAEDVHCNLWVLSRPAKRADIRIYHPVENKFTSLDAYLGQEAKALPHNDSKLRIFSIQQVVYIVYLHTNEMWRYDGKLKRVLSPHTDSDPSKKFVPATNGCNWRISLKDDGVRLIDSSGKTLAHYPQLRGQFGLTADLHLVNFSASGIVEVNKQSMDTNPSPKQWLYPFYLNTGSCIHRQYVFPGLPSYVMVMGAQNHLKILRKQEVVIEDLFASLQNHFGSEYLFKLLNTGTYGIYCPMQMADGALFIPLQSGLLELKLQANLFTNLLLGDNIRSLAVLDRQLYVGLHGRSVLTLLNLEDQTQRQIPTDRPWIRAALPETEGFWYGGANTALGYASASSTTPKSYPTPVIKTNLQDDIKSILRISDRFIWYAARSGVIELDLQKNYSRYLLNEVDVNHLSRDKSGAIWACTERGMYSFSQKRYYLDTLANGQQLAVSHFYEQNPETFWLATHQGLIRWKPYTGEYRQWTTADGMSEDILHAVYPDKSGRLWISSNYGIMSFDLETEEINVYFEQDGLCHNEQNQGAHAQDADGRLYFGSLAGVNTFHPDHIPRASSSQLLYHPLRVQRLSLYDNKGDKLADQPALLNNQEPYRLPRSCSQLAIDLLLPYYDFENIVVEWRFKQRNEEWNPLSRENQLFLLQIPYGNFNLDFRVRVQNSHKVLGNYQLALYAPPPFYYSPFFWLFSVLGGVLLIALVVRWRTQVIKAQNRMLEAEVGKRTRELEVQTRKLERLDVAKTQLFNNISHELRTPLNLIQLSAEQLPERKAAEQKQMAGQIKEHTRHITRMLEEIMNLSRLEMGMIKVEYEAVEWQSFLDQHFHMLKSLAQHKQQDYLLQIQPAEAMYLRLDKNKVTHILNNLIGNAIKYTPAGGRILVRSKLTDSEVEIMVSDTGPGIPLEEQEDIFKRYYQGRQAGSQAHPGYGIGLALCKEYVELMGGRVWVESVPEEGASFFLRFPRLDAQHEELPQYPAVSGVQIIHPPRTFSRVVGADTPKPRILAVEDNAELLTLLHNILSVDYDIHTATNGEEAFAQLVQAPEAFQLILSDIMMPVVDGFSLLSQVRSHPQFGFIPFLFLSALNADEDRLKALRLGVDAFISKPFEIIELKTQISNMINNQALRLRYLQEVLANSTNTKAPSTPAPIDEHRNEMSYDEAWLRELEAVVRANLSRHDFKVTDIAFDLHISERTLRNYIKMYTGLSPSAYLKKARLNQARLYTQQRKYKTVSEIAHAVGFKDVPYFSSAFKKEYGKLPTDYM